MPGPFHGAMYLRNGDNIVEIINHSRTAGYLSQPDLAIDGIDICNILGYGGCEAYSRLPYAIDPGHVEIPEAGTGNSVYVDTPLRPVADEWEAITRLEFLGSDFETNLVVSNATVSAGIFAMNEFGQLIISIGGSGSVDIGAEVSIAVPGIAADRKVWLRGNVNRLTALCSYWYSYDDVHTPEDALWIELGTPSVGSNAGVALDPPLGGLTGFGSGAARRVYYFDDFINDAMNARVASADWPLDDGTAAQEFPTSSGHMATVTRDLSPSTDAAETFVQEVLVGEYDCLTWPTIDFVSPAEDPAPWYNENDPASADALGIWVTAWTGLDNGHLTRLTQPRGGYGGGSVLGPMGAGGRTQKLNVVLLARTEEAMQYLFDWLSDSLTAACSSCADDTMLFYRFCPDYEDPTRGVGEQRKVGLIQAPQWEADVAGRGQCFLRQASFTLEAGDPCVYLWPSSADVDEDDSYVADLPTCFDEVNLAVDRYPCRPSCSELPEECRTVTTIDLAASRPVGPVVYFDNDSAEATVPMRAIVYADPNGIGTVPNPCGLPILGEVYVRPLPPWSHFVWDVAGKTTWFRDVTTGVDVDGWPYIDANDPPTPRFFVANCGRIHLVLEPATLCMEVDGSDFSWPAGGLTFTDPHYPDTTVEMQERTGCP